MTTKEYIATLNPETAADSIAIVEMMQQISGKEPALYNERTIGFDTYHYKYTTGREGDNFILGFYPRKGAITFYIMDGTARYEKLLTRLGKHTVKGYCIVIKKLDDVDSSVLRQILQQSYSNISALAADGTIDRILWQTEK